MDRIGRVLPGVLARQPGRQRLAELRLAAAFRELIGEPLASTCELVRLRGSTLTVVTNNPALAHQLRLDSQTVLARLNSLDIAPRLRLLQVRTGRATLYGDGS